MQAAVAICEVVTTAISLVRTLRASFIFLAVASSDRYSDFMDEKADISERQTDFIATRPS
ncbi:hypothetical protein DTL21_04995 [Bremerella cremea]|uniref:Uncharacterized protein n=1 Tax=Blastopirellula marina TaxID=124 RepID=A0A2S8FYM8_9BACT|nr:hypothetical protein C5Y83_04995 [Blastopirellula marina]RCS49694.1 hypothetical protein DTL21_04995 [Bremerella cremea]